MSYNNYNIKTYHPDGGRIGIVDPETGEIRNDLGINDLKDLLDQLEKEGIVIEDPFEAIFDHSTGNSKDKPSEDNNIGHVPGDQHPQPATPDDEVPAPSQPDPDSSTGDDESANSPNAGLGSMRGYFSQNDENYGSDNSSTNESDDTDSSEDDSDSEDNGYDNQNQGGNGGDNGTDSGGGDAWAQAA